MANFISLYTIDSGTLVWTYQTYDNYWFTGQNGTNFASMVDDYSGGTTLLTYYDFSDANQYGYVLNPYAGRGDNGSGNPVSGAIVTIGTATACTTSANGYYNINFSRYTFGFDNVSTPVTVTAPNVKSYATNTEILVDTSTQVDYYLYPVSGYGGGQVVGGGRLMATSRKKHSNDMYTGLKMKM